MSSSLSAHDAAVRIQRRHRGGSGRALARLNYLGYRVEKYYRDVQEEELRTAEEHWAAMHTSVHRLEGKLLKQDYLTWSQRPARVENFRFHYESRHGAAKSIGASRTAQSSWIFFFRGSD